MTAIDTQERVLPLGTARPDYPGLPLPSWVQSLREHQVTAVREIVEAFEDVDVVFLDAPVGAGKTLIGELVRREMNVDKGLYVCTDKALQDQFLRDFDYARVLKGKANYVPPNAFGSITCEDCTRRGPDDDCSWCDEPGYCPYPVAKRRALGSRSSQGSGWVGGAPVAVLNTAYFLAAANFARSMRKYDLIVADECDMLEGALIGFIEYEVPQWIGDLLHLDYPKKAVRKPTLIGWLNETAQKAADHLDAHGSGMDVKKFNRLESFVGDTRLAAKHLQMDVDASKRHEDDNSDEDASGRWIRDYGTDHYPVRTLKLRPVMVSQHGPKNLWLHGKKWLLMSGTIVSSDEMADSLGLPLDYHTVTIPSDFPVEHRPINLAPVANVTAKATEADYERLIYAIEQIAAEHEGRVLVHTVSYKLTKLLFDGCAFPDRQKFQYTKAGEKNSALAKYLATENAVLFAPSMDRGVDLAGDKCRVQIIAKCPFPNLGDKQVSSRMRLPGGGLWYAVKTVRDIVQMTGRGVRSKTDTCITYILDQQFTRNVWSKNKHLFPGYFSEAVNAKLDVRWLYKRSVRSG